MTSEFEISIRPNPKACKINFIITYFLEVTVSGIIAERDV
jgi:hypothetical protein